MDSTGIIAVFIAGFALGVLATLLGSRLQRSHEDAILRTVENSFAKLSLSALRQSMETLVTMADVRLQEHTASNRGELDSRKALIDQQLETMSDALGRVSTLVQELEVDRAAKFGALTNELSTVSQQIGHLTQTTSDLRRALADNRSRGQWGERIAEDILRLAGLLENVSYVRQQTIPGSETRPDFTFFLPKGLILNMDVKFPLDNYLRFLDAAAEADRMLYQRQFLADVRARVKEVVKRGYINPEQNTIEAVLLFIPNEQLFRFILEADDGLIELALQQKVILCSPLTLFIVLAIVRQAAENFAIEQSSRDILRMLGNFRTQWSLFVDKMDDLDYQIERLRATFDVLVTTRRRVLERTLHEVEQRRAEYGLAGHESGDESTPDEAEQRVG